MWKRKHGKRADIAYRLMYDASEKAVRNAFEAYGASFEKHPERYR